MCDIWIRIFKRAEEGGRVGRRASRITRAERLSILIARHNTNVKKRAVCLVGVVADVYIQRLIADLRAGVPTECRLLPLSSRSVWSTVTLEGGRHPLTCGWYSLYPYIPAGLYVPDFVILYGEYLLGT